MSYCRHCIDGHASRLVYVDGREYWLCEACAESYVAEKKLPIVKMPQSYGHRRLGHTRPPLLEEMERRMGGDGTRTLKIPMPRP